MTVAVALPLLAVVSTRLGTAPEPAIPWLRITFALLFCLLCAAAAILVIRRRGAAGVPASLFAKWLLPTPARAGTQPELEGRLRLSPASQVITLRWDDTRYLVHICGSGAQLIDRRPVAAPEA